MWKTLEELEKYLYMSQDETLRRVGQALVTLVEQEIETRLDDEINEAYDEGENAGHKSGYTEGFESGHEQGYEKGYAAGKRDTLKRPVIG